jgi:glutamate carboxypeptidase
MRVPSHLRLLSFLSCLFATCTLAQDRLSSVEQAIATSVDSHLAANQAFLEKLININSGTMNFPGVIAVKDQLEPLLEALGFHVRWMPMESVTGRAGDLVAEHPCPVGEGKCGKRFLLIGHMDTVFEPSSSFQKYAVLPNTEGKRATGPGISDMKGGLIVMLTALEALHDSGALDQIEVRIVLSGDEERTGSPVEIARRDMIAAAKESDLALEYEPSVPIAGPNGDQDSVSLGRRSSTTWHIEVKGNSGHSSQIFGDRLGYGAIYELARILDTFRRELREEGLTYSPGLILGGATAQINADSTGGSATGKANVVAPAAIATGDIRTLNNEQTDRVEARMRAVVAAHLPKTEATISFDEGYPAMAATPANHDLFDQWNAASVALGLGPVIESGPMTRGAGDIAFVATYVSGLVGVGMIGEGAHAEGESGRLDSIARQAKRNAIFIERMSHTPAGH